MLLRDLPENTTESMVLNIFGPYDESTGTGCKSFKSPAAPCPLPLECRMDVGSVWYVAFRCEADARLALDLLRNGDCLLQHCCVKARLKTESAQKHYYGGGAGSADMRSANGNIAASFSPGHVHVPLSMPQPVNTPNGVMYNPYTYHMGMQTSGMSVPMSGLPVPVAHMPMGMAPPGNVPMYPGNATYGPNVVNINHQYPFPYGQMMEHNPNLPVHGLHIPYPQYGHKQYYKHNHGYSPSHGQVLGQYQNRRGNAPIKGGNATPNGTSNSNMPYQVDNKGNHMAYNGNHPNKTFNANTKGKKSKSSANGHTTPGKKVDKKYNLEKDFPSLEDRGGTRDVSSSTNTSTNTNVVTMGSYCKILMKTENPVDDTSGLGAEVPADSAAKTSSSKKKKKKKPDAGNAINDADGMEKTLPDDSVSGVSDAMKGTVITQADCSSLIDDVGTTSNPCSNLLEATSEFLEGVVITFGAFDEEECLAPGPKAASKLVGDTNSAVKTTAAVEETATKNLSIVPETVVPISNEGSKEEISKDAAVDNVKAPSSDCINEEKGATNTRTKPLTFADVSAICFLYSGVVYID